MPAFLGPVMINAANILTLPRKFSQPGTTQHLLPCDRADPDLAIFYMTRNPRPVRLPPVNFGLGCNQIATAITHAAFSTLITVFHLVFCRPALCRPLKKTSCHEKKYGNAQSQYDGGLKFKLDALDSPSPGLPAIRPPHFQATL